MSLFFRPARAEARAIDPQTWITGMDQVSSPVYAGQADSIKRSLRLVPVYAATRIIADDTASLPLQAFRKAPDGSRQDIDLPKLFQQPSAEGTLYDWVFQAVTSLTLRGNAVGLILGADRQGYPTGIEWLNPEEVHLEHKPGEGLKVWWNGRPLARRDVLHVAGYTLPGSPIGLSPIAAYATTVDTGIYAAEFGRDWFRNGSIPSGVVETTAEVSEEQASSIKSKFKRAARYRDVVAMGAGAKFTPISVPANESQFLDTMHMTATQIANIYGIRPERIGGHTGESMTYKTIEQNSIVDAVSLRPWVLRLENAFNAMTPRPQYLKFNFDSIIRADTKTRYEAHRIALGPTQPFLTVNEVREYEDEQPLDGGDVLPPAAPPVAPGGIA